MLFSNLLAAASLVVGAFAETPEGFKPNVTARLDVTFGTKAVNPPGLAFTKAGKSTVDIAGDGS